MVNWNFNPNDVKEVNFEPAPAGDTRVKVVSMTEKKSQSGLDMWEFIFKPSGGYSNIYWYLTFDPNNPTMTNTNLRSLWNSFGLAGVPTTNVTSQFFTNAIGAVRVKHDIYNGETRAKVHYLITKEKQVAIPQWQESKSIQSVTGGDDIFKDNGPQF